MNLRAKMDSVDLWTDVAADLWQVELPSGAVRPMRVEELDAAFERGDIGLHTRVQRPSGGDWHTLGEIAGVDDSIRPVSADYELVDIPRPPPLPELASDAELTSEELAVLPQTRIGHRLAAVAAIGLLAGGLLAWRYMPAQPTTVATTTTIYPGVTEVRPPDLGTRAAAVAPAALEPAAVLPVTAEASTPPDDGVAVMPVHGRIGNVVLAKKPMKAPKKPLSWKERGKLRTKTKKHA